MSWSPQQSAALKAAAAWIKDPYAPQVFRLFGFAGTGKTTLAIELANEVKNGLVLFGAYTGKAALVMRSKGCSMAQTIHSMIYKIENGGLPQPTFSLSPDSEVKSAKLVMIDEVSMVDEELARDLLSYGTKVLVLGDPAQLPPVKGTGFFITDTPDVMLTEVHRQAQDNPIIRISMDIREGRPLELGHYGETKIISRRDLDPGEVLEADQVLVGMNKTRRAFNNRIRTLYGIDDPLPIETDRLVCLRNNKEKMLLNGGLWQVEEACEVYEKKILGRTIGIVEMKVTSLDEGGVRHPVSIEVPDKFFYGRESELEWRDRRGLDEFDYGYALTVHKSQGSQWSNVMVFDESKAFRDDAQPWLYTAVTRAADKLTVVV